METVGDLYRKACEASPVGFLVLRIEDPKDPGSLRQIMVNDAACRITEMDMRANNGELWRDAYPDLVASELANIMMDVASSGKPQEWQVDFQGSVIPKNRLNGSAWVISNQTVALTFTNTNDKIADVQTKRREKSSLMSKFADQSAELESAVEELDAFTYSVSHDLRAPLRRLDGFSQELLNEYGDKLDETGRHYLNRIRAAAQKMGRLIDDLLKLSRISRREITQEKFDLGALAGELINELSELDPDRNVEFHTEGDLELYADKGLFRSLMQNLLSNAWKYSADGDPAHIEIGSREVDNKKIFYVKDDGVGFDMKHADNLFRPFQRLHSQKKFEGTGIGLATVQRIINRHGGKIWAESESGKGATFFFYLNQND